MRRKILFRGKNKESGEWEYGSYIEHEHCIEWCDGVSPDGMTMFSEGADVIPETVCEFTGLTAKGTKIFEGDILKIRSVDFTYTVNFEECAFKIKSQYGAEIKATQEAIDWLEAKVIGNIYDNPELLNSEE